MEVLPMTSKALRLFGFNLSELCLYSKDKLIITIIRELGVCSSETLSILSGLQKQKLVKILKRLRKRGIVRKMTEIKTPYYALGDMDE